MNVTQSRSEKNVMGSVPRNNKYSMYQIFFSRTKRPARQSYILSRLYPFIKITVMPLADPEDSLVQHKI